MNNQFHHNPSSLLPLKNRTFHSFTEENMKTVPYNKKFARSILEIASWPSESSWVFYPEWWCSLWSSTTNKRLAITKSELIKHLMEQNSFDKLIEDFNKGKNPKKKISKK